MFLSATAHDNSRFVAIIAYRGKNIQKKREKQGEFWWSFATCVCEKSIRYFFLTSRATYDKITLIREKQRRKRVGIRNGTERRRWCKSLREG